MFRVWRMLADFLPKQHSLASTHRHPLSQIETVGQLPIAINSQSSEPGTLLFWQRLKARLWCFHLPENRKGIKPEKKDQGTGRGLHGFELNQKRNYCFVLSLWERLKNACIIKLKATNVPVLGSGTFA